MSCSNTTVIKPDLDIQGHRGCRGLMPENTIAGFIKAVDLGVTTLELDVVVSKDSQLIVSHEAFFHHEISSMPDGKPITEETEKMFNIYQMTVDEIGKFDVGLKDHPRFPLQSKLKSVKPTLVQMVDSVEQYITINNLAPVKYNVEIKHKKELDLTFNPPCDVFCRLVYDEIVKLGILQKTCIQSFDPECLNAFRKIDSTVQIALLVENRYGFKKNLDQLNFTPEIYSPNYQLIDGHLIEYCRKKRIKLIPWTVNDESDIIRLISQGIDGIISDYPDKVIEIYQGMKHKTGL